MGWIEVLFFNKLFGNISFGAKILIKTAVYLLFIFFFLLMISWVSNSVNMGVDLFDSRILESIESFIFSFAYLSIMIYIGSLIIMILFISDVSDNLGLEVLKNYLIGKYHRPREEERIFMFLDMKSSTTIAEKLGHVRYFELLKSYYSDISDVIIHTSGEIYEYVGDEIIISWRMANGIPNLNCIRCFFQIKQKIDGLSAGYDNEFGWVPQFKAGLHYGKVTTGEIGVIKKDIIFTGDVLNTTSRIQNSCNQYGVDILISESLLSLLKVQEPYGITEIGEVELRGKDEKVRLFTVSAGT